MTDGLAQVPGRRHHSHFRRERKGLDKLMRAVVTSAEVLEPSRADTEVEPLADGGAVPSLTARSVGPPHQDPLT